MNQVDLRVEKLIDLCCRLNSDEFPEITKLALDLQRCRLEVKMNRVCCYIYPAGASGFSRLENHCTKQAEWEIWNMCEPAYDNMWDSCSEHVGELLTDAIEHRIYRISQDRRSVDE